MQGIDKITFQVISTGLTGIVREMQLLLFRTGYSTAIRESQDASCAILDRQGRLVAQFRSLYMHMGIFPVMMEALFHHYPPSRMEEGDVYILNHPYHGGSTHVSDMGIMAPVFYRGELVAFCASMAHKTDIGGSVPGSASAQTTEIYQEGLLLPPLKFVSRGRVNQEIEAILRANSRTPEIIIGDMRGQIGVCRIGEDRIGKLMDKYGRDAILGAFQEGMDRTEKMVKNRISQWPDGAVTVEAFLDPDGLQLHTPVKLQLTLFKKGEELLFDFTGSDDQTQSPLNLKPSGVLSACYFGVIAMIGPSLPNNAGLAGAVRTKFRPHSVLNPDPPGPVSCYVYTLGKVLHMVLAALRRVSGQKPIAESGKGGALTIGGHSLLTGDPYIQYELFGGGGGAVEGDDGVSNSYGSRGVPGRIMEVPLEIIETEFACRMLRYELIPDSGGPGQFRGGPGIRREYLILDQEARLGWRSIGFVYPAVGDEGGLPGRVSTASLQPAAGERRAFPCRIADVRLKAGDILRIDTGGGGGVGDPRKRPRDKVLGDREDGYITERGAAEDYGLKDGPAAGGA